jgi:hypothetical protein
MSFQWVTQEACKNLKLPPRNPWICGHHFLDYWPPFPGKLMQLIWYSPHWIAFPHTEQGCARMWNRFFEILHIFLIMLLAHWVLAPIEGRSRFLCTRFPSATQRPPAGQKHVWLEKWPSTTRSNITRVETIVKRDTHSCYFQPADVILFKTWTFLCSRYLLSPSVSPSGSWSVLGASCGFT